MKVLQVAAFVGVIASGQTLVLLVGGIDLSQAGVVTLVNIVATGVMMGRDTDIALAVTLCLGLAVATGLIMLLMIVQNAMRHLQISAYWQYVLTGVLALPAVAIYAARIDGGWLARFIRRDPSGKMDTP